MEQKKIDILLAEYNQLNGLYKQRDTIVWVMATIFIPATIGILSYAALKSGQIKPLPLAIGSLGAFAIFRFLVERMRYFSKVHENRMKSIERILGMNTHCRFRRIESKLKKMTIREKWWGKHKDYVWGSFLGVKFSLDLFMLLLTIAWSFILGPFVLLVGIVWFFIWQSGRITMAIKHIFEIL